MDHKVVVSPFLVGDPLPRWVIRYFRGCQLVSLVTFVCAFVAYLLPIPAIIWDIVEEHRPLRHTLKTTQ